MIPKREKDTDISSEIAQGKYFQKRVRQHAEEAASRFIGGENLNAAIASIAAKEDYSRIQIQRLVEESNTLAFNKKYDEVKKNSDRRVSFELGTLDSVVEHMGDDAPPVVENPNWVKGRPGDGEIAKVASAASTIITPNSHTDAARTRMLERRSKEERKALEKEAKVLNREIESGIFKIAQSLVRSERVYGNGNELFNTILSDTTFEDFMADGIAKKAEELAEYMKNTGRVHDSFVVSLKVNPQEKIASTLFGNKSLVKEAETGKVQEPKVAPIQSIGDYQQLISLAKEIQRKQELSHGLENQLHGGATNV